MKRVFAGEGEGNDLLVSRVPWLELRLLVGLSGPCPWHFCGLLIVTTSLLVNTGELIPTASHMLMPLPNTGFPQGGKDLLPSEDKHVQSCAS